MISFSTFDIVADALGQLQQVNPGLVGPVQDIRFSAGTSFCIGSLDFTANKASALRPLNPSIFDPTATSLVPFDLPKIDFHDDRSLHDKETHNLDNCALKEEEGQHGVLDAKDKVA
uniref:Uncharacterized protein n=1 Tax=Oryza glumipatula TaxID=40148 RepID=A0A0D9Z9I0_9ORYZ